MHGPCGAIMRHDSCHTSHASVVAQWAPGQAVQVVVPAAEHHAPVKRHRRREGLCGQLRARHSPRKDAIMPSRVGRVRGQGTLAARCGSTRLRTARGGARRAAQPAGERAAAGQRGLPCARRRAAGHSTLRAPRGHAGALHHSHGAACGTKHQVPGGGRGRPQVPGRVLLAQPGRLAAAGLTPGLRGFRSARAALGRRCSAGDRVRRAHRRRCAPRAPPARARGGRPARRRARPAGARPGARRARRRSAGCRPGRRRARARPRRRPPPQHDRAARWAQTRGTRGRAATAGRLRGADARVSARGPVALVCASARHVKRSTRSLRG